MSMELCGSTVIFVSGSVLCRHNERGRHRQRKHPGSEVPTDMIAEKLDGLAIGSPLQILEDTNAQQQDWLDSLPAIVGAVTFFQLFARPRQNGVDFQGEETIAVVLWKKRGTRRGGRKKIGLSGERR
jgi:hypothetical protein